MVDTLTHSNYSPKQEQIFENNSVHFDHESPEDKKSVQDTDKTEIVLPPKLDENSFDSQIEDDIPQNIVKTDILTLAEVNEERMEHRFTMMKHLSIHMEKNNKQIDDSNDSDQDENENSVIQSEDCKVEEARSLPDRSNQYLSGPLQAFDTTETGTQSDPEKRKSSTSPEHSDLNVDEIDPVVVDDADDPKANNVIPQFKPQSIFSKKVSQYDSPPIPKKPNPSKNIDTTGFKNPFTILDAKNKPSGLPKFSGFLKKKAPSFLQGFQKRYFILEDKKLRYYENDKAQVLLGVINFDLLKVSCEVKRNRGNEEIFPNEKKKFKLSIDGAQRIFILKADNDSQADKWIQLLSEHIVKSDGYKYGSNKKLVLKKNFWKDDRISEAKFLHMCDTGDIILFKTKNFGGKIQRTFTRSEYDHVGMILKYSNGEIVLFESTGKEGVGLCRWRTFKKNNWHHLYSKMVYRRLNFERTDDTITNVEKFVRKERGEILNERKMLKRGELRIDLKRIDFIVKQTVGKKYKVSAKKLFKKKSDFEEEIRDDQTFFCSELVAACYKRIGLLPKELPSSGYLPGTFSEKKKKLSLIGGAKVSSEYLIDFSL